MQSPLSMDGLTFGDVFDGIIDTFFPKLYSPEKAELMRRAYAAAALTILSVRAPFGKRSLVNFPPVIGLPFKIGENTTRNRVLSLYIDVDPTATFIYSSGPGPGGGGSDFVGDGVGEASLLGNGVGARLFILFPSEELWATQIAGTFGPMTLATEAY